MLAVDECYRKQGIGKLNEHLFPHVKTQFLVLQAVIHELLLDIIYIYFENMFQVLI